MFVIQYKNITRLCLFIFLVGLIFLAGKYLHIDGDGLEKLFKSMPSLYSSAIFVFLYVTVTFFVWFSKDIFRLIGAIVFGAYLSTLLVFISEAINAFILFYTARFLGRDFVNKRLNFSSFNLSDKLGKLNLVWLVLIRMVPLVPFRFMDLSMGLLDITFRRYLIVVLLGSLLRIFWLQFILAGIGKAVLSGPDEIIAYLSVNKLIFIFTFIYFIMSVIVALKLNKKEVK